MPTWPALVNWLAQFPRGDRRMLVIAHREELLDQSAAKLLQQNPTLNVSVEQADRYASATSDVVVASIQTLAATKFARLDRLLARGPFRIVVVDEAHHAAAATYRTALTRLGFLPPADATDEENIEAAKFDDVAVMTEALGAWDVIAPRDRLLVGVTATPIRSDAIGLGCVFQCIAYSYALKDAVADGWLVPLVPWVIETDVTLDNVKTSHGDFNQRQLADAVNNAERNKLAVAGWAEHADGRSTIAFTVDVAHAHALAETFRATGVEAAAVSGETPREERRQLLRAFSDGRLTVLANCMVLTEGTDLPIASCILHAKPTKSATLYEQMTGRGLRLYAGKADCIVLDVVDVARKHSLQTAPVLYGLPPNLSANGKTLEQLEEILEDLRERHPALDLGSDRLTLEQLRAKASTFDIWTVRPMEHHGAGLAMNWIRTGDESFRLEYPWEGGKEILNVEKNLIGQLELRVSQRRPTGEGGRWLTTSAKVMAAGVTDANACLKLAEAFIAQERAIVHRLKDRDAPWRLRPASPKQAAMLKRYGVPAPAKLTAGQASDLIDTVMARKRA